jgi:hypothetical protein
MSIALGKTAAGTLMSWKQRYGNVFTVWVGPFPLVCVGDYKLAVEEFIKKGDVHSGRYPGYLLEQLRGEQIRRISDTNANYFIVTIACIAIFI